MQHFYKNRELARLYGVSDRAVGNWIQAARKGTLDLQLVEVEGRPHIANTQDNRVKIKEMVEANKKYRRSDLQKTVSPTDEFYKIYSPKQVRDIIANIKMYRELPFQYSYFEEGANYWSQYAERIAKGVAPNTLTSTVRLLESNQSSIDSLIDGHSRVNIIDIGVGDAQPVKGLLAHLLERGVLARYIAIDISPDMLTLAERNIKSWFGDQVAFTPYVCDISREGFDDVLVEDAFNQQAPLNLALLFGGTLSNLRVPSDALRAIRNSLWQDDVLLYVNRLDTPNSRQSLDFNVDTEVKPLSPQDKFTLDLLNIEESFYEVEQRYDEQKKARTISVRLQVPVTIEFKSDQGTYAVNLNKGDALLLWRSWHQNMFDVVKQFDQNGFSMLQASLTQDYEYLLTASRITIETD